MIKFFIPFFLLVGCLQSSTLPIYRLNDRVRFKFENDNSFYAGVCKEEGTIKDLTRTNPRLYLVEVECEPRLAGSNEFIWINESSILGKSLND